MALYGYKKDATTTIVGAALNKEELQAFYGAATTTETAAGQTDLFVTPLFVDSYESDMMMHLTDPEFQGFTASVYIFEHESEEQQKAFIEKHDLLIGTRQRAIDRNTDMVNYDAPDPYDVADERTLEEIHGLGEFDKYDKRSDEERDADKQMKKMMDEMKKKGELSNDDSFSGPKKKDKDGNVIVTDIRTTLNADGSVDVDNILAVKLDEQLTNAVLDMKFGDKTLRLDVNWNKRDLESSEAEALRDDLYFGAKYQEQWAAGLEPVLTVTTRDGAHTSGVKFQEMIGELVADAAMETAPHVDGTEWKAPKPKAETAPQDGPEQSAIDGVLDRLSQVTGQKIDQINIVDPETGLTEESFKASGKPDEYVFAFWRGDADVTVYISNKVDAEEDNHISVDAGGKLQLPAHYGEVMEGCFKISADMTEDQVRAELIGLGLTEDKAWDVSLNA